MQALQNCLQLIGDSMLNFLCDVPDDNDQIDHALLAALEQPRERVSAPLHCTSALLQMVLL
jgi:hypothetical protein